MRKYTTVEQIAILGSCKTANELLEVKELLQELQEIEAVTQLLFDRKMNFFLISNNI